VREAPLWRIGQQVKQTGDPYMRSTARICNRDRPRAPYDHYKSEASRYWHGRLKRPVSGRRPDRPLGISPDRWAARLSPGRLRGDCQLLSRYRQGRGKEVLDRVRMEQTSWYLKPRCAKRS
jgi:hypothetical protein